jgi:hypothetical protein
MMEICLQGEALLPFPLEDEFIEKVKDAVGYIVRWPKHLVIQCSDLVRLFPYADPFKSVLTCMKVKQVCLT